MTRIAYIIPHESVFVPRYLAQIFSGERETSKHETILLRHPVAFWRQLARALAAFPLSYNLKLGWETLRMVLKSPRPPGVSMMPIDHVNSERTLSILKTFKPDIIFSIASNQIFGPEVLKLPTYGCYNIHSGKLPHYRGCLAPFWAMLNDDKICTVTLHRMTEKIDGGEIIAEVPVPIEKETLHELLLKILPVGGKLINDSIPLILAGKKLERADLNGGHYYQFPDRKAKQAFLAKGYRFT